MGLSPAVTRELWLLPIQTAAVFTYDRLEAKVPAFGLAVEEGNEACLVVGGDPVDSRLHHLLTPRCTALQNGKLQHA